MTEIPFEEPEELDAEPADHGPPEKLAFEALVYGWLKHVHLEVEALLEQVRNPDSDDPDFLQSFVLQKLEHIHASFEEALRDLGLSVPEHLRKAVLARASSRRDSMGKHPLPPFPVSDEVGPEVHGSLSESGSILGADE